MTVSEKIINKVELPNIVKTKRGNSPEITSYQLVDSILSTHSLKEVYSILGIGEQTLNRIMSKYFIPVFGKVSGGNQTWKYILLNNVGYKECHCCRTIKPHRSFNKDATRSDGLFLKCKGCRSLDNSSMYGRRKLRIPSWYAQEKQLISSFYENCPEGYHVDHIIPLQGTLVSGLHTLSNLQYLLAHENILKGNSYGGVE